MHAALHQRSHRADHRAAKAPASADGDGVTAGFRFNQPITAPRDPSPAPYPRLAELRLLEALADSRVVPIHDPRQCGKTPLTQAVGAKQLVGVEVKAAATVTASDFRGLRKLQQAAGRRFAANVVLYDGEASAAAFGERRHAVAIRSLWEAG